MDVISITIAIIGLCVTFFALGYKIGKDIKHK